MSTTVKDYKKWVLKAHNAAKEAEKQNIKKEQYPAYIVADNIAKQIHRKLIFN